MNKETIESSGESREPNEINYLLSESTLSLIKTALEAGLEHARTALIEHDRALGRTTRKNELWAEVLERDVTHLEESLNLLSVHQSLKAQSNIFGIFLVEQ